MPYDRAKRALVVLGAMALRGTPVHGGRGSGPAHLLDPGDGQGGDAPTGSVLVAGSGWRPTRAIAPPEANGLVVEELVRTAPPVTSMPVVAGLEPDLFREGERVEVDGTRGEVLLPGVTETSVVTAFLRREDGRILLLRRSGKVRSFQGRWAAVSGYVEDVPPYEQALREVREETGLGSADLVFEREGSRVYARDGSTVYVVHPFLFLARRTEVRTDWEHSEFEWVDPGEIAHRTTVPKLDRAWQAVGAPSPTRRKG